jgi:hypothetical protein
MVLRLAEVIYCFIGQRYPSKLLRSTGSDPRPSSGALLIIQQQNEGVPRLKVFLWPKSRKKQCSGKGKLVT